jgi:hypothetical protein
MGTTVITANHYAIQQIISGTGVFDGSPVGYARREYSDTGAEIEFRAKCAGTDGNAYKVGWPVPTETIPKTIVQWDEPVKTLRILPRAAAGVILATTKEIVDAVNHYKAPSRMAGGGGTAERGGMPLVAATPSDVLVPSALAVGLLTKGLDPHADLAPCVLRYTAATNDNGGIFIFDNHVPWTITDVGGHIDNTTAYTVKIINLLDDGEGLLIASGTSNASGFFGHPNLCAVLMPGQAVLVEAACDGTVFVYGVPAYRN